MPRSKLTDSEQVVRRHQQAEEAAHKHQKKMLFLCVRHFPQCVSSLWQQVLSLGYSETKILSAQEKMEKECRDVKRKRDEEVKLEPAVGFVPKEPVKEKAHFIRDLDVVVIRDRLLPHIEAGALSSANMKKAEKIYNGKQGLLRILEMATGIQEGMELVGRLRCLHELTTYCVQRAQERGHRCARFQVGGAWEDIGLYKIKGANAEGLTVHHKFMDANVVLGWADIPKVEHMEDLKIQYNWSETDACLAAQDVKDGESILLLRHFPEQTFDPDYLTPQAKQRKTKPPSPAGEDHPLQRKLSMKDEKANDEQTSSASDSAGLAGPVQEQQWDGYDVLKKELEDGLGDTQEYQDNLELHMEPPEPPTAAAA